MTVEEKLKGMGITLPTAPSPVASYVPAVQSGNLVFSAGQIPTQRGELRWRGQVGADVSEDEAYQAASVCALNALAAIKSVIGDLDRIIRVVRVNGFVSSAEGFTNQPVVINGASDLLVELFGEAGRHSRVSVGVAQLPAGAPVEVDLVVEVEG